MRCDSEYLNGRAANWARSFAFFTLFTDSAMMEVSMTPILQEDSGRGALRRAYSVTVRGFPQLLKGSEELGSKLATLRPNRAADGHLVDD
jgi:hypothetical protein